jgi:hypothetical protein
MKRILLRLATELRTRGPVGFARFIASRLVLWRGDLLYEIDLRQLPPANGPTTVVQVDRHTIGSAATDAVEKAVLTDVNAEYRQELQNDGQLFALLDRSGVVTCYGFVLFDSFYKRVLGEQRATPMISNCFTFPEHRGLGQYPAMIAATCRSLAAQGFERAIITCAPDNIASVHGIEKAGFRGVKGLHSLVLGSRWIAWQTSFKAPTPRREQRAGQSTAA